MTSCRYAIFLLLSCTTVLHAAPSADRIEQLKTARRQLQSDTRAIRIQIRAEQARIRQLEQRIEDFQAQNKALDRRILDTMQRYRNRLKERSGKEKTR